MQKEIDNIEEFFDERLAKASKQDISECIINYWGKRFVCVIYNPAKITCPFFSKDIDLGNWEEIEIKPKNKN